jgi:SAM-dependent methyltransferase
MIHHETCPLCLSSEISHFLSCTDHFVSKEIFTISQCEKCGFRFTQDYPEEDEAGRYYESDDYISHSDSRKGITEKAYQFIRRIMLGRKKRIISKITGLASGNILDIGAGTGHFLNEMKLAGWNIKGVEINSGAREYAASRFGIDMVGPDDINTIASGSFDCITLWHVLEHFHEPFEYMKEISRLLKPEGVCLIALPNCNSYDAKHFEKEWAAYDVPRHLWHFNPSTFSLFAEKNGFTLSGNLNLPFDVFYISILSEKYKVSGFPVISGLFKGVTFSLRSIFTRKRNSSVIYILRKATS